MENWQIGLFGLFVGVCAGASLIVGGIRLLGLSRQFAEATGIDAEIEREVYKAIGKELIDDAKVFDQPTKNRYPGRIGRDTFTELGRELINHQDQFDTDIVRDNVYGLEMQRRKQFYLTKK